MVKCIVVRCKTGYKSNPQDNNIGFFSVPSDPKLRKSWQKAILRDDIQLKAGDPVCRKHFHSEDILLEKIITGPDGSILGRSKYKNPQLRKGALPALHLGRIEKRPRKSRNLPTKRKLDNEKGQQNAERSVKMEVESTETPSLSQQKEEIQNTNAESIQQSPTDTSVFDKLLFQEICKSDKSICTPISWARSDVSWGGVRGINFSHWIGRKGQNGCLDSVCTKQVLLDESMHVIIKIYGKFVDCKEFGIQSSALHSIQDVENVIRLVEKKRICQGCPEITVDENLTKVLLYTDKIDHLRHKSCPLVLPEVLSGENSTSGQCKCCKSVKETLRRKIIRRNQSKSTNYLKLSDMSPTKRDKIRKLKEKLSLTNRSKERAQKINRLLKKRVKSFQERLIQMKDKNNIDNILSENEKISANEKIAIKEILKAANLKDPRGRRYSDDWIILSILLHMRSPVTFRMIRDNKILPLPDERTIRRYLSQMDCPCGFDPNFFDILKEHFCNKTEMQLHGLLLMDEMGVRKNLLLDQTTMKFKGLSDFGEDKNTGTEIDKEMADHGLVIVFQPLYDDYSQPIAVFASKGPTPGNTLAKIAVQAIVLLEKAGAKVHGIVADGGSPNRKMWSEMGCSGKMGTMFKNWFTHPTDQTRKVFFFSDAPHLMKTIRNRLVNKKELMINPDEDLIKWEHFQILHEVDKFRPVGSRICPKITDAHINIEDNSLARMRVSLVLQLFSKSAARGLRYYKAYEKRMMNCESTAKFCELLNDMFDALNRTLITTGLRLGSHDITVLEEALAWLNAWEERVKAGLIHPDLFLTDQTAEGLRMTLNSTLDLTKYLLDDLKLEYVLTGKINQDSLEVFMTK